MRRHRHAWNAGRRRWDGTGWERQVVGLTTRPTCANSAAVTPSGLSSFTRSTWGTVGWLGWWKEKGGS